EAHIRVPDGRGETHFIAGRSIIACQRRHKTKWSRSMNFKTFIVCGAAVLLSSTAFGQDEAKPFSAGSPLDTVTEAGEPTTRTGDVRVLGSFRFAESCTFEPERNLLVVMNGGAPQDVLENDGYVSLLNPDGTVHTSKWIGATRDGLTLNHPLGSAIADGTLYAADINVVRTFDLATGEPGDAYEIPDATFLNGIGVSSDGTIYVSNTREPERIYQITSDGEVSVFLEGAPLAAPNGVAIDPEGNIVVVNIGEDRK